MIYFIAAGKGSRMNSSLPKALHNVNGTPNLQRNIEMISGIDDYRVVVNRNDFTIFSRYIDHEKLLPIVSGLGSGHAVMQIEFNPGDIIIWGDAVITDPAIITELKNDSSNRALVIPLKKVNNPYVNFLCDSNLNIQEVLFSKYKETGQIGYQDCCIFKVNNIQSYLRDMHNVIWKSRYITESHEFEFLYVVHYLYNIENAAEGFITEYPDGILSYNTQEELKNIEDAL